MTEQGTKRRYVVLGQFFSELQKKLTLGERTIQADNYEVNEIGALTFLNFDRKPDGSGWIRQNIESIPPTFWLHVAELNETTGVENPSNIVLP